MCSSYLFQFTPPSGGGQVTDEIKSSFHNYTPVADFFSNNVSFEAELIPKIFYSDSLGVEISDERRVGKEYRYIGKAIDSNKSQ